MEKQMSFQGLPAEETAQLFDSSKHCETSLSNVIIHKSGMLVFSLIPQITCKRQTHWTASSFFTLQEMHRIYKRASLKTHTKQTIPIINAFF